MKKKVLSEQALYWGNVSMPKGFEIDTGKLSEDILHSSFTNKEFPYSKTWDMLNTYIIEHIGLEYNLKLKNQNSWGSIYKPNQRSKLLFNANLMDLYNSPDFTLLYGVKVNNCFVEIHYDDNRRKGKSWNIELKNNEFIMFPSTNVFTISNEQKENLNFIQTIVYEYV